MWINEHEHKWYWLEMMVSDDSTLHGCDGYFEKQLLLFLDVFKTCGGNQLYVRKFMFYLRWKLRRISFECARWWYNRHCNRQASNSRILNHVKVTNSLAFMQRPGYFLKWPPLTTRTIIHLFPKKVVVAIGNGTYRSYQDCNALWTSSIFKLLVPWRNIEDKKWKSYFQNKLFQYCSCFAVFDYLN
jgi:hypothetical protein